MCGPTMLHMSLMLRMTKARDIKRKPQIVRWGTDVQVLLPLHGAALTETHAYGTSVLVLHGSDMHLIFG